MAVVLTVSNHFKYQLLKGNVDFDTDTFKIILMNNSYTFDKDTDATLADVTASQIPTGNGYTQDTKQLAGVSVTEDDTNDKAYVTWSTLSWVASGGSFSLQIGSAVIYDDTTSDDTILGCIDFGTNYTITDGNAFIIEDIQVDLS